MFCSAFIGIGIIILLASLFADLIGIGFPGFGTKQVSGTVVGAIIVIISFILYRKWAKTPQTKR